MRKNSDLVVWIFVFTRVHQNSDLCQKNQIFPASVNAALYTSQMAARSAIIASILLLVLK